MTDDMKEFLERLAFLLDRFGVSIEGEATGDYDVDVTFVMGPDADNNKFTTGNYITVETLFKELGVK